MQYIIDGGKYAADLIRMFVNDVQIGLWYFDYDDENYIDNMHDIYESAFANSNKKIVIIAYRAARNDTPTERLTIRGDIGELYDYYDKTTEVFYIKPRRNM